MYNNIIGETMYMHHKKEFNGLGELVALSPAMQMLLPGASLESGYAISGPDDVGYYGIRGPDIPTEAFTSGLSPFRLPGTQQLIFQPKQKKKKPTSKSKSFDSFTIFGWVIVTLLLFTIIK
jgi:hypothetical protein